MNPFSLGLKGHSFEFMRPVIGPVITHAAAQLVLPDVFDKLDLSESLEMNDHPTFCRSTSQVKGSFPPLSHCQLSSLLTRSPRITSSLSMHILTFPYH